MRMLVRYGDGPRTRKNGLDLVLSFTHPANNFLFRCNGFGGGELAARNALIPVDDLKFSGSQPGVKIGADLGVGDLAHSAPEPVAYQCAFIDNGLALEVLVTGKGKRFSNTVKGVDGLLLMLGPFPRSTNHSIGLVSEVGCQLPVRGHYLSR